MSIDHGKLLAELIEEIREEANILAIDDGRGPLPVAYYVERFRALAQPAEADKCEFCVDGWESFEGYGNVHHSKCDVCGGTGKKPAEAAQSATINSPETFTTSIDAAQVAVALQPHDLRDSLQRKCSEWGAYWRAPDAHGVQVTIAQATELLADAIGVEVEITHPQAAPAQGDGEMAKIGRLIETQDNRITEAPIFIVQQKRWICGVDPDYGGERVWINHARESVEITDEAEIERLDAEYAEEYTAPEGYTLTGKMHVWDFVTACFTEQGCKDYLARDGHNLCEPRIYAAGSYRNEEWRSVRKFLMSLAAAPSQEPQ